MFHGALGRSRFSRVPSLFLPALLAALAAMTGCEPADSRPATWDYLHAAIIEPGCATSSCHSALATTAGLRFDEPDRAFDALLERQYVLPGDPQSPLLFLLDGDERDRMPPDAPLPHADVELIRAWIVDGAVR